MKLEHDIAAPIAANRHPDPGKGREGSAARSVETMQERHQRMLKKLAEMAMELSEAAHEEAVAEIAARKADPAKPEPVRDPMLSFSRMARTVRQTVALESKLEKERKTEAQGNVWADYYCRYVLATVASDEQKRRVRRVVKREIERSAHRDSEREILTEHLSERLDDEGEWRDLTNGRSTGEIIEALCEVLGLDPNWNEIRPEIQAIEAELEASLQPVLDAERWPGHDPP